MNQPTPTFTADQHAAVQNLLHAVEVLQAAAVLMAEQFTGDLSLRDNVRLAVQQVDQTVVPVAAFAARPSVAETSFVAEPDQTEWSRLSEPERVELRARVDQGRVPN